MPLGVDLGRAVANQDEISGAARRLGGLMRFRDRRDAGRRLAERLALDRWQDPVVLGLPRGGVPVAYEVARRLVAPLDVLVARKIGSPRQPEFGIGAIAEGGARVLHQDVIVAIGLSEGEVEALIEAEQLELDRRVRRYRGDRPLPHLEGHDVILVDDGLATGVTANAGVLAIRAQVPRRLVMAAPVCAPDTAAALAADGVEGVCLHQPQDFRAVGHWYRTFDQTTDDEVVDLLADANGSRSPLKVEPPGDDQAG